MSPGLFARLSVILALLACSALAWSETLSGKVVAIADGDSLTVLDTNRIQHKVRLAGIDAPEKAQPARIGACLSCAVEGLGPDFINIDEFSAALFVIEFG